MHATTLNRTRPTDHRDSGISHADATRLDGLIAEQERIFRARQPASARFHQDAVASLAGGVTSSWQISQPDPIWISHGRGSRVWDVDGHEYVDYHGGYGVGLVGHAHPAIVEAVTRRVRLGTHFGQPCPDAPIVADELAGRFGLPLWRFSNSGTEATMNAVHLARSLTGRHRIIKFEGAYHGHHDSVRTSIWHEPTTVSGANGRRMRTRASSGIPVDMLMLTRVAPYNDLRAVEDLFEELRGEVACVIVEPILMNCGIIYPAAGFLEGLRRLTEKHGALLIFDEVKTGLTVHSGGATRLFGITPDIVCLAKALGGGLPIGAIGGTQEVMDEIVSGRFEQVGTMNGNPLSMAAARAVLLDALTADAYKRLHTLGYRMAEGAEAILRRYALTATIVRAGPKGSISYCARSPRDYADFKTLDGRYAYGAWLVQYNGGVFLPPWSKGEQWLVSTQHTEEDVDCYLATLERFAQMLRG
jgi:glutamate-1-semialdehyde 2,1-aminomutase